jgi:large subunit ribosomal protein L25
MAQFESLKVDKRTLIGRKVKLLRRQGIIPANIFGNKISSISVQVDHVAFHKVFDKVGETAIVEVVVGDDKYPCLISGMAIDPVTSDILHIDFHHVSLKEKVTATIPVHMVGEAPAVKDLGGILNQSLHELEVEALPTDLPEAIEVDVTHLTNMGDSISVKDLKISDKVTLTADPDTIILVINEPAKEEEVVVETPTEAEVIGEEKTEDGASAESAPAEAEKADKKE